MLKLTYLKGDLTMGKIIWSIITLGLIFATNWGVAEAFQNQFLDWAFLTGLASAIVIHFFNSSGGFTSDLTDSILQSGLEENELTDKVWTRLDRIERHFKATPAFYVAMVYTVLSGIVSLFYYL